MNILAGRAGCEQTMGYFAFSVQAIQQYAFAVHKNEHVSGHPFELMFCLLAGTVGSSNQNCCLAL